MTLKQNKTNYLSKRFLRLSWVNFTQSSVSSGSGNRKSSFSESSDCLGQVPDGTGVKVSKGRHFLELQKHSSYSRPLNLSKLKCKNISEANESVQHSLAMDLGPHLIWFWARQFGLAELSIYSALSLLPSNQIDECLELAKHTHAWVQVDIWHWNGKFTNIMWQALSFWSVFSPFQNSLKEVMEATLSPFSSSWMQKLNTWGRFQWKEHPTPLQTAWF